MMKGFRNMVKKWDIIIIVVLLIISLLPDIIFLGVLKKDYDNTYAEITVNGKVYKNINLSSHIGEEEFKITTSNGFNVVKIKDDSIAIIDSNCPDMICEHIGYINKPGDNIVCLPNRVMIEIKGKKSADDDLIMSY